MPAIDALVLLLLERGNGAMERGKLIAELGLDSVSCTRSLNRLEEGGCVFRSCGVDRRTLVVELLDGGWDVCEDLSAVFADGADEDVAISVEANGGHRLLSEAILASRGLSRMQRDLRITRTQAFALLVAQRWGLNTRAASSATRIAELSGIPRTTARSALRALQKRGLL